MIDAPESQTYSYLLLSIGLYQVQNSAYLLADVLALKVFESSQTCNVYLDFSFAQIAKISTRASLVVVEIIENIDDDELVKDLLLVCEKLTSLALVRIDVKKLAVRHF